VSEHHHAHTHGDVWFVAATFLLLLCFGLTFLDITRLHDWPLLVTFAYSAANLATDMSLGVAIGILSIGAISRLPQATVMQALTGGRGGFRGIARATMAGGLLDVCCHGVLLIAADLYKRGATLGQMVAFLVASPWNSLSTLFILISLIGLPLTASIFLLSLLVAFVSGMLCDFLVARGVLAPNPVIVPAEKSPSLRDIFSHLRFSWQGLWHMVCDGLATSKPLLRWIMLGVFITAAVRTLIPQELFAQLFGPSLSGLGLTLIAASVLEVCSAGSAPLAAELVTRAGAPGNAFVFLMAGVATNFSVLMILRQTTGHWKTTLFLPLILVPQIVVVGWLLNFMR
jgi:uncharacterized membrane protein YraQ (UPF0718 family)